MVNVPGDVCCSLHGTCDSELSGELHLDYITTSVLCDLGSV